MKSIPVFQNCIYIPLHSAHLHPALSSSFNGKYLLFLSEALPDPCSGFENFPPFLSVFKLSHFFSYSFHTLDSNTWYFLKGRGEKRWTRRRQEYQIPPACVSSLFSYWLLLCFTAQMAKQGTHGFCLCFLTSCWFLETSQSASWSTTALKLLSSRSQMTFTSLDEPLRCLVPQKKSTPLSLSF